METKIAQKLRFSKMKKVVFGLIVALAGALLLGFNLGYLPIEYKDIIFSWPMILVALGLVNISSRDSLLFGLLLFTTGAFFLLPKALPSIIDISQVTWPFLLIVLGVWIAFRKKKQKWHNLEVPEPKQESKGYEKGKISETNVFGGSRVVFDNEEFKGGEINNVFGGSEIDLSAATLADGENILEINCVFGGVKIIVPQGWNIKLRMDSVMGGFHDKRKAYGSIDEVNRTKILIIKGSAIFGGGELRSV